MRQAIPLVSVLLAASPALAAYNLVKEYSGTDFFSGWDFYDNFDNTTNGKFHNALIMGDRGNRNGSCR